jgi:hypothetical protein
MGDFKIKKTRKLFNNKKAIELSINFVVLLIIALVVFGMGLTLFRKFFVQAEAIQENLDEQTRKELQQRMMNSLEQVVIYPTQMTIKKGRGDVFGVGILNIGNDADLFYIEADFSTNPLCYNRDGESMACDAGDISVIETISRTIKSNERQIIDVPVRVSDNAASGKYAVKVEVRNDDSSFSKTNLVYINVP